MQLPKSRQDDLVLQHLENEMLVYDLVTNKAFSLNETSAIVFNACDGRTTFADLKARHSFTDELIFLALDELKKESLLADDNYQSPFAGISRREAARKVGLATMIAMPVIMGVVAPTAVMAQSGASGPLPLFSSCTTALECASRACSNNICCLSFGQMTSCTPAGGCINNECCSGITSTNLFGCASPFSCLCN